MSFGFRKGFKSGPFRMTFSKSGVSMSVGAGGARLTAGPRGTHVSFSKGGFYYRTRLDAPHRGYVGPQAPPLQRDMLDVALPIATLPAETAPCISTPEIFGDTTPDAVVEAVNRRIKRRNYALPIGIVISGGLVAASVPWPIVAVIGVLSTLLVALQFRRSKYSALVYGSEEGTTSRLEVLHKAVAVLRSADSVWSVREATLANGLTAHPPTLSRAKVGSEPPLSPKYLHTNITPAALQLTDGTLYFFPDRLFVWHSGQFAAIDYRDLKLQFSRVTFLEREKQPSDAAVESQMRRSLAGESTIPVFYYGLVEINAVPALHVRLMTSRVESAQEFVKQMRAVTGGVEPTGTEEAKEPLYTHFDTRVPLFYNLKDDGLKQLQAIRNAFAIILQCDCVWRYEGEERTDDWKRHAGAGTLVTRSRVSPTLVDQAPGIDSNVAFGFCIGSSILFLLPDGFVLRAGERYEMLGKILDVNASTTSFREEEVAPRDGEVIGKTWRYVNKSGGPDRRFNDNRQIPIYRYGQLEIGCGSWRIRLCLSRANAAAEFAAALTSAMSGDQHNAQKDHSEVPPPKPASPPVGFAAALSLMGLQTGASFEDVSAAYKSLAAQNHPDKVAHMAPEFRELAERKMRDLNAAYEQIRTYYQKGP